MMAGNIMQCTRLEKTASAGEFGIGR